MKLSYINYKPQTMSLTTDKLQKAVDIIFARYDFNHNNTIEPNEMISVINSGLRELGKIGNATFADAREFIQLADADRDERLSKKEMMELFRKITTRYSETARI